MPFLQTKCTIAKRRAVSIIAIIVATLVVVIFSIHNANVRIRKTARNNVPSLSLNTATANSNNSNNNNVSSRFGNDNDDTDRDTDTDTTVCLTRECFQQHGQRLARAFSHHLMSSEAESWCIPTIKRGNKSRNKGPGHKWQGLLLVKTPKAASSTAAGIVLRIHNRHGCAIQWQHVPGKYYVQHRTETSSLLITTVRNPTSRALSHAWYGVFDRLDSRTRRQLEPTDENIIHVIQSKGNNGGGYQFKYLLDGGEKSMQSGTMSSLFSNTTVTAPELVHARIKEILDGYDLILVAERMDESLTALALLTGLDIEDVLVKDSKVAGHYIYIRYGYKKDECHFQQKASSLSQQGVGQYFESNEWLNLNYADEILWRAANASLDKTIEETLGRHRFDAALQEYKRLKRVILDACPADFGCNSHGKPLPVIEKCYDRDFGCGYECIDMALQLQNQTRYKIMERGGFNKTGAKKRG